MDDSANQTDPRPGDEMMVASRSDGGAPTLVRIEKVLGRSGAVWAVQAGGGRVYLVERAMPEERSPWRGRVV